MKTSHLVLVVMAVLVAVIGVGALAGPSILRAVNGTGGDGRISIAIATPTMLRGLREAAEQQAAGVIQLQNDATVAEAVTSGAGAVPQNPPQSQAQTQARIDAAQTALTLRTLEDSSLDGLGNELAGRLGESRRFDVKDTSQFMRALRDISARADDDGAEPTIMERLRFWERNSRRQSANDGGTQINSEREGGATFERQLSYSEADFQGAGRAMNVDYVLVVALAPGGFRRAYADDPYVSGIHIESRWEPTLIFRVFDVRTGEVIIGEETTVSPAIVVRETGLNDSEVASELRQRLNDRVADMVAARLMGVLSPARIVSTGDTLTINRGSNDGVREGQVYDVQREEIGNVRDVRYNASNGRSADGPALEAARVRVGQLRILTVQGNISTAAPIEGELSRGDIVVIDPSRSNALSVSTASGAANANVPLGEGQSASNAARPALAVGGIRVETLEPPIWRRPSDPSMLLSRGIAGHLTQSGQVDILTRSDLERLLEERRLTARSQGIQDADVNVGVATAGYLLTGEVQISASQAGETISVGGQSRQTRTAWRLTASGTVRVQTTDGRTIYSVPVRTQRPGSPQDSTAVNNIIDAFAADAAAALLVRMFPLRIASRDGATVTLNRGPEAGLREGTRLAAFAVNQQRARRRLGELVVTDAAPGYNASARFVGTPFSTDGNVELEVLSGAAPAQTRTTPRTPASQSSEPAAAPVQW